MLLRGGTSHGPRLPQEHRSTRDLLRRRMYLMRHRAELLAHIQNTNTQYNLPGLEKRIGSRSNRTTLAEHFEEPMVRSSIEADIQLPTGCTRSC